MSWILAGILAYCVLSVPVALILAKSIGLANRRSARPRPQLTVVR